MCQVIGIVTDRKKIVELRRIRAKHLPGVRSQNLSRHLVGYVLHLPVFHSQPKGFVHRWCLTAKGARAKTLARMNIPVSFSCYHDTIRALQPFHPAETPTCSLQSTGFHCPISTAPTRKPAPRCPRCASHGLSASKMKN